MIKALTIICVWSSLAFCGGYNFWAVLDYTLKNAPEINMAKNELEISKANLQYSQSSNYPQIIISANSGYSETFDEKIGSVSIGNDTLSSNSNYQNSLSLILSYDIFKFGSDSYAIKATKENLRSKNYEICAKKVEISLRLLNAYEQALILKNRLEIYKSLKRINTNIKDYSARLNIAGEMDLIATTDKELDLLNLNAEILKTNQELNLILNQISSLSSLNLSPNSLLKSFANSHFDEKFLQFENTYKAMALKSKENSANYSKIAAQREKYPTISLYARYDFYGDDQYSFSGGIKDTKRHGYKAGINFTWRVFDGFRQDAKIKTSELELQKVLIEENAARLEYEKEIADIKAFLISKKDTQNTLNQLHKKAKNNEKNLARLFKVGQKDKISILSSSLKTLENLMKLNEYQIQNEANLIRANILGNQNLECVRD